MSRRRRPSASNTRARTITPFDERTITDALMAHWLHEPPQPARTTPYSPAPTTDAGLLSLVGRDAQPLLQAFKEAR